MTSTSRTSKDTTKEKRSSGEPAAAKAAPPTAKAGRQSADASTSGSSSAPAQKKPASRRAPAGPYAQDQKFLAEQRQLLETERAVYLAQASDLKAEADSLAQEREPGDVQFDEESGEGGTVTVDRERDLALSAQALAAVEEIDAALARTADGTYGECERCEQPIPKPRLKALPYARLCVACKSGGLSRR
ncbi:MAG TPA: TraR/DksA C4-type zinc finger protein [Acidimicrobiales bacterium]|nr:TraR/DksA C4-type zinc finger protein [Acidimicrobiales bacterium]